MDVYISFPLIAYDDTMKILILAATCISVIPILLALTMPNWYLGDKQNAVDDSNLAGERVADDHEENPAR